MANEFYALMGRMRYITRWGLMRNSFSENIQEHSHQVAVLAHALALIRRDILKLPTPIKYYNPDIKDAYKQVERIAGNRLLDMLPQELRASYEHYVLEDDADLEPFVKAADKLSAHIKCLEEQKAGNTEFDTAAKQTWDAMKAMGRPELNWFLDFCLGAFALNLDQL